MSDWHSIVFAQQGWQCPICGAVYSPTTVQCFNCTGRTKTYTVSNKVQSVEEYLKDIKRTKEVGDERVIRKIDDLWCDDITFCQEQCEWRSCPRNQQNIRDRTIPHSYSVEIPQDCPKKKGEMQE